MLSARWLLLALGIIALTTLASPALQATEPKFGQAEVSLAGSPAPVASAAVCGLRLVAGDEGPQVVFTEMPAWAVVSVHGDEEVAVRVPIGDWTGPLTVHATAELFAGPAAEVNLELDGNGAAQELGPGQVLKLEASRKATGQELAVRLTTRAKSAEAAVRWRDVQVSLGDRTLPVPFELETHDVDDCPAPQLSALRPPVEQLLIEWDWRMQDGIETPREPVGFQAAIERTLQRGDLLIADLQAGGTPLNEEAAGWQQLRTEWQALSTTEPEDPARWEDLWRRVHQLRRTLVFANPLAQVGPLAFVKQVPSVMSHQLTQYYGASARPGGGVFVLDEPGRSMQCRQLAADALSEGSYQFLDVSYEGDRLLTSYCRVDANPADRRQYLDRFYHLYEMNADGSNLRQLTDEPYDDFAPRYLPNGKIIFVSTRRGGYHRCGAGPCPVYTLALANADGSDPQTISFHETQEWDPAVLHDGRVVYTRWDYVDRHAVHYQQLWSVRPDGSDVRVFYGNNTLNPVGVWEPQAVPGSNRVMATAAAHHAMTAGSIILLDVTRGIDGLDPITRLTPDALFPESEVPVLRLPLGRPAGTWHAPVGVTEKPPVPPEAVRWPGHCYRTPYPLSEKYFLAAYSFDPLIGEPTWNRANMFGLYLVDAFGNKELLYRDLNIASQWPAPLRARPRPAIIPSALEQVEKPEGTIFLHNVYESRLVLPDKPVKRLRIVQVLPKTTPNINNPTVGLANASPGRQVLGTVPVEADGSAHFLVPAGIALAFQALDERGQAIQTMRSITYLQPGETVSCIGCHESRFAAPPRERVALALQRSASTVAPGPDGSKPLSYPILVQPVLDAKCVECHNREKAGGDVVLTGEPEGRYTVSYNALAPRVPFSAWQGGDFRRANSEPYTLPDFFGARGSKLMAMLLAGHEGVVLSSEDIERLATWMDANALFYGTFDPADQARQQRGERIAGPALE